ncbi:hypothetical protein GCL60_13930 [Silvanigrella paludirubra]|uniref:Beta-ketoacyl-[acyl-carrier-protein] synthase III N-terminal domain-containing protein n=1 Tax=Silvanigrella paludirubra TaxID=2499159 RepID=A0A6N6VPQ9_9BACT|nr:hypothetical protein [Silvanigrella paludirubra]KAB8036936.1 hypothetical protein GCL60_13930 [Silvanigrella paludirubra]
MINSNLKTPVFANIKSSFCYLAANKITNLDIAKDICLENKSLSDVSMSILKHTGIFERRYAQPEEAASDLAIKAILNSSLNLNEIEALIVATTSGDYPSPATAHLVHKGLKLNKNVHCLDIASSCTSFISALRGSLGFVATNSNTVVIATEVKNKGLLKKDLRTRSLFADAASGVYLEKNNSKNNPDLFLFCYQESISSLSDRIYIPVGGSREPTNINNIHRNKLELNNPKETFFQIVKSISEAIEKSLETRQNYIKENFELDPVYIPGLIFIHQANKNIIKEVKSRFHKNIADKIPILMGDIGNSVCASLPVLRTRVLFLKSIFFSNQKIISKKDLIPYFIQLCNENNEFRFIHKEKGILFSSYWQNESIDIFDDGCDSLENSWLNKISEDEFNQLQTAFQNENISCQNKSVRLKYIDIWIAAGGGFQTLAMLHGKVY